MSATVTALRVSAAITVVAGIVCGLVVSPALFGLVLVGVVDLVLARMFASGRLGSQTADPVAAVESDPSYNPYARED